MLHQTWIEKNQGAEGEIKAYCLFCETGSESKLAQVIREFYEGVYALPLMQERHKSEGGKRSIQVSVMLPGYIFLYTLGDVCRESISSLRKAYFFLEYEQGECELIGSDRAFALWVLRYGGVITCSKALREGDRVLITEGPLRSHGGQIRKIDKHRRNAQVDIAVGGRVWTVWLAFDWVEDAQAPSGSTLCP